MILITGFGPYREDINASGILVQSFVDDLPDELMPLKKKLAFAVISCDDSSRETEHQSLEAQLNELLKRHEPQLCIHTGQAPPYIKITIEKIATNSFMRKAIGPARPVAYWSNLPGTDELKTSLEQQDIPAGYSFYGGQHLCNHILYSSLYMAETNRSAHKSEFIHIPVLPEQVTKHHRDSAFMPLEMTRRALGIIINYIAVAHTHRLRR